LLNKCSDEFKNAYQLADLIIAKGQGNLEGLLVENDPRIFFLLLVKCSAIANMLGVEKGSFIVANKLLVKQLDRTTESTYSND
ncbi:MAG: ARMT1-like domain-containing protein, partial [Tenuifilaceae bacterium]|nr:ARMT1-like domain-containing protein [Tenuifilaceae bacterium]